MHNKKGSVFAIISVFIFGSPLFGVGGSAGSKKMWNSHKVIFEYRTQELRKKVQKVSI
jgi:hypothetical protein